MPFNLAIEISGKIVKYEAFFANPLPLRFYSHDTQPNIFGGQLPDVFNAHGGFYGGWLIKVPVSYFIRPAITKPYLTRAVLKNWVFVNFNYQPWSLFVTKDLVSLQSGAKRPPNKKYAICAQYHSYESGTSHEVCPDRRGLLRRKVLLISAIIALFIGCLGNAVRLGFAGKDEAAIYFWGVGVAGVFATFLVGIPIIFDLF
jgi:hypothetical protein